MNELETALDDVNGLHEAFRALGDGARTSPLVRNGGLAKKLRHDLAAGADAYLSTLMSSSRGELDHRRVKKCRALATDQMPSAISNRRRLATLVEERRVSSPEARDDMRQLVSLSLHCRAALAALAPTVDRRMADAIGNKVLVELRAATLLYAGTARTAEEGGTAKARAAVVEQLKKTESHANEFVGLAPAIDGDLPSLGAALSKDVVNVLHDTAVAWAASPAENETA